MILHRFCSEREFAAYIRGETLVNHTDHYNAGRGGRLSHGFCFFQGNIHEWARRLNGVVDFDVLITVDADPRLVHASMGVYADWSKDDGQSIPPKKHYLEYYTDRYDKINFRLLDADRRFSYTHISHSAILSMQNDLRHKLGLVI